MIKTFGDEHKKQNLSADNMSAPETKHGQKTEKIDTDCDNETTQLTDTDHNMDTVRYRLTPVTSNSQCAHYDMMKRKTIEQMGRMGNRTNGANRTNGTNGTNKANRANGANKPDRTNG